MSVRQKPCATPACALIHVPVCKCLNATHAGLALEATNATARLPEIQSIFTRVAEVPYFLYRADGGFSALMSHPTWFIRLLFQLALAHIFKQPKALDKENSLILDCEYAIVRAADLALLQG